METFQKEYQKLNQNQKQAVDTLEGPVMVVAGPGTGKTQVLGLRMANILEKKKAAPEEILALTFSDRAAVTMQKRLARFIGVRAYDVIIKTFHSFSNDIILDNAEKFKQKWELTQLDELEQIKMLKRIIKKLPLKKLKPFGDPFHYKKDISRLIGDFKKEGLGNKKLEVALKTLEERLLAGKSAAMNPRTGKPKGTWQKEWDNLLKLQDLALIYKNYQAKCRKRGVYDYDDMVLWVLEKLEEDEELRRDYQERFRYILSDEYQDTNSSQNRLIEILAKGQERPNVFVVGDDDQAIYRFQGANLANILAFHEKFPEAKFIAINTNYRSLPKIVKAAAGLIASAEERLINKAEIGIDKEPHSYAEAGKQTGEVSWWEFSLGEVEEYFIAQKIKELNKKGIPYSEMAVLTRDNAAAAEIAGYLMKAKIPVETASGGSVLETKEGRQVLNFMGAVLNLEDDPLMYRLMSLDWWGIEPKDFWEFRKGALKAKKSLYAFFRQWRKEEEGQAADLAVKKWPQIGEFFTKLETWHKESVNLPAVLILEKMLGEAGIIEGYLKEKNLPALNRIAALFNFSKKYNQREKQKGLADLYADLVLMQEEGLIIKEGRLSMAREDVRVMTAHAAKGEEFKVVFLPRLNKGVWDGRRIFDKIKVPREVLGLKEEVKSAKEDDERRLFFVAMTRAKEYLFLTRSEEEQEGQRARKFVASRFLEELDKDLIKKGEVEPYEDAPLARMQQELAVPKESKGKEVEAAFLRERVKELTLNPTNLNLYLNCPQRFKLEKLFLVPRAKTKFLSLGTAVHKALEEFFGYFKRKGEPAGKEFLLKAFRKALEEEVMAPAERPEAKAEGEKMLSEYYDNYSKSFKKPLALETKFGQVRLDGVRLTGTVDKIEALGKTKGETGKQLVKVIDYKTGRGQTANQIKGLTKSSNGEIYRQLTFYKLLSRLDKKFPWEVAEAEVDFIKADHGKFRREPFVIKDEEVAALEKLIKDVIKRIKQGDFSGTKDTWQCENCEMREVCDS